jgi:HlyD family secretion protein
VPVQVVANRAGKKVYYVVRDDTFEQREVQTGLFNDTFVEITEGLEVGEKVLLVPPRVAQPASTEESSAAESESPSEEKPPQEEPKEENDAPPVEGPPQDSA